MSIRNNSGRSYSELSGSVCDGLMNNHLAAIALIDTLHPNAILLDLKLKQGTGFGVLRHINTMATRPSVVVVTNYALSQYRRHAELLGARFFLDKSQEFRRIPEMLKTLRNEALAENS